MPVLCHTCIILDKDAHDAFFFFFQNKAQAEMLKDIDMYIGQMTADE